MQIAVATDTEMIQEITRRIVAATDPLRVILFGSRARGVARADSDFDFLVIQESAEPRHRRAASLYTLLADLPVEVDVMVYTPKEVALWENVPEAFVSTAIREGQVLHERSI
jgi:uncharacterized protein